MYKMERFSHEVSGGLKRLNHMTDVSGPSELLGFRASPHELRAPQSIQNRQP